MISCYLSAANYYARPDDKNYDRAIEEATISIRLTPWRATPYRQRAEAYCHKIPYPPTIPNHIVENVIEDILASVSRGGTPGEILDWCGKWAYHQTLTKLDSLIEQQPECSSLFQARFWIYYRNKQYKEAARALEVVEKITGRLDSLALQRRATCYMESGESAKAFEDYNRLAIAYPQSGLKARAVFHERRGQFIEAIKDYSRLLELYPNTLICVDRGNCHEAAGQYEAALKDYTTWIKLDTSSPFGYLDRGRVKEAMKNQEEAMKDYNTGIALVLSDRTFRYDHREILCDLSLARGRLYLQKGEREKAMMDFQQILATKNWDAGEPSCWSRALAYLGRENEAKDWIRNKIENEGYSYNYEAVCLFSILGEYEEALKYLHLYLEKKGHLIQLFQANPLLEELKNTPGYKKIIKQHIP